MNSLVFEWVTNKFGKRNRKKMNGTMLLGSDSSVVEHCTDKFTDKLFQIERWNVAAGIKEAAAKRRKLKCDCNQWKDDWNTL